MQLNPELEKRIEIEYLRVIADLLQKDELTVEVAKQSANDFLALLPFNDFADMEAKLKNFIDKYPQLVNLEVILLQSKEDTKTKVLLEKMRDLMKNNKVNEAIQLAKQ